MAFRELGGGVNITDLNPEDFASIDFRDKTLTPTGSQEQKERPKEASFMDRILRGGSGCLHAESLVSHLPVNVTRWAFAHCEEYRGSECVLQTAQRHLNCNIL